MHLQKIENIASYALHKLNPKFCMTQVNKIIDLFFNFDKRQTTIQLKSTLFYILFFSLYLTIASYGRKQRN